MLARQPIQSMSDAQHYISSTESSKAPLSNYVRRLRKICLQNPKKTKLFWQRAVRRHAPFNDVQGCYHQRKLQDWPFEGLDSADVRHCRNLIDAAHGRLAVVADDAGSIAFQLADKTIHQPQFGFAFTAISISAPSSRTICCTQLAEIVSISSDLATTELLCGPRTLARPTSIVTDPINPNLSLVATSDSRLTFLDARRAPNDSAVIRIDSTQRDGIVQISPTGTFFSVRSPRDRVVQLFDIRMGQRQCKKMSDCIATQWMPNRRGAMTLVKDDNAFYNLSLASMDETLIVECSNKTRNVVDFFWDSAETTLLTFFTDAATKKSTMATKVVYTAEEQFSDTVWVDMACDRDCADFAVDRYDQDTLYLASSCELITTFDFVAKRQPPKRQSKANASPTQLIKYTVRYVLSAWGCLSVENTRP